MPEVKDPNLLAMLNGGSAPPPQPAQPATPGIIRGRPKAPTAIQLQDQQFKAQDQQFQAESQDIARAKEERAQAEFNNTGGPGTADEKKIATLTTRIAGGLSDITGVLKDSPDAAGPGFVEALRGDLRPGGFTGMIARGVAGAPRRAVVDTQRDVLDALLTLGTGAAYAQEQLDAAVAAHFPQYGDSADEIKLKNQRFERAVASAKANAGPAWLRVEPMVEQYMKSISVADNPAVGNPAEAALRAEYPDAVKFHYSNGEFVGYEDKDGEFVIVVDVPKGGGETPPEGGGGLGQSLYAGVGDVAEGIGDVAGIIGNPLNAGINAITGSNLSTDLGQTFRDATGAPQGNALASAINKGGVSAMTGAGLANAAARGGGGYIANALASQPVQQVVGGAAAGASAEGARMAGAPAPVQAGAGLVGGMLGYGGMNALMNVGQAARAAPAAIDPTVAAGQRNNTRVLTSDVIPPKTVIGKTARKLGEVIPIAGTSGQRVKQQAERTEAVKSFAREYDVDEATLASVAKDLTAERSRKITLFDGQKKQILENVTVPAPAPRAIAMLDQQIAAASKVQTSGSQAVVSKLQDFKKALQNGDNTIKELEAIRKEMGTAFKDPSLANIADAGMKAVRAVYNPLKDDIAATIRKVGGDETARTWRVANARLSGLADELQSTALKSTLNKAASTPEDVSKLIFSTKPSQVRLLYNNLSAEGRAKAQGVIIGRALEKAGDDVNPTKFVNELDRMSKNTGVFFQDADLARVEGLSRLLNGTRRAQEAGVQPETGAQLTPWVAPTVLTYFLGAKGGLAAAGGAGLLARFYESAPVRDALLKLGRTKPNSPQEAAIVPKVMAALVAANENPKIAQYVADAPGLSQAAASDQVGEERPIQP